MKSHLKQKSKIIFEKLLVYSRHFLTIFKMVLLFWRLIYQFRNSVPKWMILQICSLYCIGPKFGSNRYKIILDFYSFYKNESFLCVGVNRLALTQLLKKVVLEWNNFSMSISNICKRNVHFCKTDLLGESNRKRVLEVLENIKAVFN